MIHKPIQFKNASLTFSHKACFEDFNAQIRSGDRIAIIGKNGSGKSSLLKILQGAFEATSGEIKIPDDARIGYAPQIIEDFTSLSGGQRFNKALTHALRCDPNILLLDEPTNHLDLSNRKSLMRMLCSYSGTLLIVSHDVELLRNCVNIIWHIDNGRIHIFSGSYDDYIREIHSKRSSIEKELAKLGRQKKEMHQSLMKEQMRAASSRAQGEKNIDRRKWPGVVSEAKARRAEETSGHKKANLDHKKQELNEKLSELHLPEIIKPKFYLSATKVGIRTLVSISEGCVGYGDKTILRDINLSITTNERIAIMGDNGSGKSTLIKAILDDPTITKSGSWHVPEPQYIGYLDQHYGTIVPNKSVLENIQEIVPTWIHTEVRRHLNDFLFRKNEEVNALGSTLSGGEKARLSLAQIAAKTPRLLILDEITNNLDLETREHIIQVLQEYPGAMIIISHDTDFLKAIRVTTIYRIENWHLMFS